MNHYLADLFEYNDLANRDFIRFFQANAPSEKAVYLFSHLLNAHHIWLARIAKHHELHAEPKYGIFQVHDLSALLTIHEDNHRRTLELLHHADHHQLEQVMGYTSLDGRAFENKLRDILLHLINHSTYHRAQVASLISQQGITPPRTDYILYKRQAIEI